MAPCGALGCPSRTTMSGRVVIKRVLVAVMAVAVVLGATITGVFFGQRALIYHPDASPPGSPGDWGLSGGRNVTMRTADGLDLSAWLFEPSGVNHHAAILFAPGNGGNRSLRGGLGEQLADLGYTALLLDYRGFGGNPGSPTEQGLALDAQAGADWLRDAGFPPDRTLYVGESLGTGVVVSLAVVRPPAGVLLRSPYTSLADVAAREVPFLPVNLLLKDRFDTTSRLHLLRMPITVMAGSDDTLVPTAQSVAVAESAPNLLSLIIADGIGHNDVHWLGPDLPKAVDRLAQHAIPLGGID